ncbi:plasma membrane g protein coupled receptor that interacts with the heterotrimeric g protein a [Colletotrichum truncatum]|uniref:Plasma membrane g protein coupled receptor that interacts with the heterotrimeric g protein a n=1 Tax=Colletotrichum truncatum TaxID=5467 RepID=A0ACC3YET0_COLTU|nr:plasma membrane g protein coupled receptor that interacts with the heterotrimeric g protein a [Colletotrichum truncatum]KAF6783254.1 plasma membrane g protein coupled receptor that interacts with the heterotrimeric g protein a [Colletotrichum truncatum]
MAPWPRALEVPDGSQLPPVAASEILSVHLAAAYDRIPDGLPEHQWTIIQSTSLAAAALSVAAVSIAFYWFSRMRRSFRHDLIMLLMSSDMLKSLWFIIFPIADFKNGPIPSESSFCQASGFFLSVGIEASDIAVVLIALHTAIYIFRPRDSGRQNGLYPHRRTAFGVFIFVPLLMASLAFINWPGYANNGEYCYLPVRPEWTRLALSWVPRYMILLTIVALYAYIYIYVSLRIRRFGRLSAMRRASATQMPDDGGRWAHIPSVPPTPSSRRGSETSTEDPERQRTSSTATTVTPDIELIHSRQKIQWNWPAYGNEDGLIPEQDESAERPSMDPSTSPMSPTFAPISPPPHSYVRRDTIDLSSSYHYQTHPHRASFNTFWHPQNSAATARAKSLANIWSILRRGTSLESGTDHNGTPFLFHPAMDGTGMTKTRDKIRRQLRLLFVYPIVYILIWAVPFVAHVMRWDNPDETGPFAVVLLSLVSLSIQGLVNACLFCAVEKPWIDRRAKYKRTPSKLRRDKDEARQRVGQRASLA